MTASDTTPAPSSSPSSARSWTTPAGTVREGMQVLAADGSLLGHVDSLEGEELLLRGPGRDFVATSQIDGISENAVLLSGRGDGTFGLGAQP